ALTLVYDARNRLSRVDGSGGTVQANHYNGRGERVRKVAGALDRRFAYDESGRLLGEFDAGGAPLQLFVWMDDQPVAVVEGTALRYIETDHLNTPRALIDPARSVAVWRWDLQVSAFGEHAANEDPDADGSVVKFNLRFPGQYLDAETGLHYNYFRDYEAATGRYVESDPIGLHGGINTYAYVEARPLGAVDPDGLQTVPFPRPVPVPVPAPSAPPRPQPNDPYHDYADPAENGRTSRGPWCPDGYRRRLQDEINASCKPDPGKCLHGEACDSVADKFCRHDDCATKRKKMNDNCFKGGNRGHQIEYAKRRQMADVCAGLFPTCVSGG
ncbi:MAG: RHS repeat domain-containing protein, partial [Pseudomonadota bacterium]